MGAIDAPWCDTVCPKDNPATEKIDDDATTQADNRPPSAGADISKTRINSLVNQADKLRGVGRYNEAPLSEQWKPTSKSRNWNR